MSAMNGDECDVCLCGHIRLIHENDWSWCWVHDCECTELIKEADQ